MNGHLSSVNEAKNLLSVVPFIWLVLTSVLLGTAWRWSSETEVFHVGRSFAAVAGAVVSTLVGGVVVIVMAPLAYKVTFVNDGPMEGILVLFQLVIVAVLALTAFSVFAVGKAVVHLREVIRAQ